MRLNASRLEEHPVRKRRKARLGRPAGKAGAELRPERGLCVSATGEECCAGTATHRADGLETRAELVVAGAADRADARVVGREEGGALGRARGGEGGALAGGELDGGGGGRGGG